MFRAYSRMHKTGICIFTAFCISHNILLVIHDGIQFIYAVAQWNGIISLAYLSFKWQRQISQFWLMGVWSGGQLLRFIRISSKVYVSRLWKYLFDTDIFIHWLVNYMETFESTCGIRYQLITTEIQTFIVYYWLNLYMRNLAIQFGITKYSTRTNIRACK